MRRVAAAACAIPLLAATPAAAESARSNAAPRQPLTSMVEPALPDAREGVSLPVVSYTAPDGGLNVRQGIIAGFNIAPKALIGIGLFKMTPKRPSHSLEPADKGPTKSRKAAVGLTLNF